ncbi:hypothetical protein Golax_024194, partial [Gossypium laxum]|nr:hypothetical protein [Gossypium laxum]
MDAKMMFPWMRWMSRLHNHNRQRQTKIVPHFQRRRKKKIYGGSEQIYTSLIDAATLLGENILPVGLELSRSIASEMIFQR